VFFNLDIDCCSVHEAAARSHLGCLQTLLSRDSSTAATFDDSQKSILHAVTHLTQYCTDVTSAALQALHQQQQLSQTVNLKDTDGHTALQHAVLVLTNGEIVVCHGCFRLLLAAGADVSAMVLERVLSERSVCVDLYPEEQQQLTVQALVQRGCDLNNYIDYPSLVGGTWFFFFSWDSAHTEICCSADS
jgi:hypothetical protein